VIVVGGVALAVIKSYRMMPGSSPPSTRAPATAAAPGAERPVTRREESLTGKHWSLWGDERSWDRGETSHVCLAASIRRGDSMGARGGVVNAVDSPDPITVSRSGAGRRGDGQV
jgi:hypothetical protein